MLKGIPACISPDLMHALMTMGHGEEIVLADVDFPVSTYSQRVIRADGTDVTMLLEAILPLFPLDSFVEKPVATMDCSAWGAEPESYERYREIMRKHCLEFTDFDLLERFDLYARAAQAYAVVVTGEPDGNLLLKKGPVMAVSEIEKLVASGRS